MSEFNRRLEAALAEMDAAKIKPGNANPPLFRWLQKRGYEVPPPPYAAPLKVALGQGGFFGLLWGIFMWGFTWSRSGVPLDVALIGAVFAGALFATGMSLYYSYLRKKHTLTPWDAL